MESVTPKDKQSIKTQRVKSYFIKAAKEIIIKEGIGSITVRKIADLAGYSYTSIYNYYDDLDALLGEVKKSMIGDLALAMKEKMPGEIRGLSDIKASICMYIDYYIEYPNIFMFFYSYHSAARPVKASDLPDFEKMWRKTYGVFVKDGVISEEDIVVLSKTIIYGIQGLLALYFSDNGLSIENLYEDVDKMLEFLLKGRKEL